MQPEYAFFLFNCHRGEYTIHYNINSVRITYLYIYRWQREDQGEIESNEKILLATGLSFMTLYLSSGPFLSLKGYIA